MKGKTVFGALLVSVALSSQAFSFELLDRMLGLNGGCGTCDPCGQVACCEPACAPEPSCCETACCDPCCGSRCDLFGGMRDLFACRNTCGTGCEPACCESACAPEPACCDPCNNCIRPLFPRKSRCSTACCEPACCESACDCGCGCGKSCGRRCPGLLDVLGGLFCCKSCNSCKTSCCEQACGCGDAGCGCGCGGGEAAAPAAAPAEEAAPLPKAPDPSASIQKYYRGVVRN